MRILVTGATGQLGRALRDLLGDTNAIFCDRSRLDIARLENVQETLDSERPDLVINAAAYTRVDDAESNIEAAFLGNALGPRNLAIATRARAIPLLHVSTDYVFDGRATRPYHEY
ncbi:MAG TPA: sugar nucleotide-binding protein, partial [Planctomycetota bacterium]|nr:sugar nucleotide-binding protein [Planctomycetota bacterium]